MIKHFKFLIFIFLTVISSSAEDVWIEGTAQPKERITISSPVEEVVEEVFVEEGDNVVKGDVLAKLLSKRQELAVKKLEHLITKARFEFEAVEDLYAKKIESRATYLEKKAELGSYEVDKELAENDISERLIKSPSDGVIVYRLIDPGESAEKVEALFELIDASSLKLVFFLTTDYLDQLKVGNEVVVDFPEVTSSSQGKATLKFIDPQVDSRSGLFRVMFEFDNAIAKIKPGVRVRMKVPSES
ncbi:MAG: efflux transporter periplasmic adaptor subunit [Verrucomicrobiales bacterium]|nr:efflux transporter periplasmic adaptor subunit [Verrucomicrobiales bacterium]HAA88686.1 efflux RND transporter periplasmic adaptor subunit [Verrucomicrobiales bacterium]|tara:strand:+ start:477 stop:1208 length:732 start_codon:yes stop_codon:yes gene_type:complete